MARDSDDDRGGGGFSGKRTKTWRELDASRGKGRGHTSRQDDPAQQRIERSASYEKYKAAADALFTGGELPEGLAKTFDPDGKRKAQKQAMQKLMESAEDSVLAHPRERITDKALDKREAMEAEGKLVKTKLPKSLDQRLKGMELTHSDPDTQERAKTLRAKLRA